MSSRPVSRHLDEYLDLFAKGFRRRDQRAWAKVYLSGLLAQLARKNVENIARYLPLPLDQLGRDPVQALQHFLNQSTWDEETILAKFRDRLVRPLLAGQGALILDEIAFAKRGRHSVGVQRQFSDTLGGKVNCQVAVLAEAMNDSTYLPLSVRLYLPERWLSAPERLGRAGVLPEFRERRSRTELVMDLLRRMAGENMIPEVILCRLPQRSSQPVLDHLVRQPAPFLAVVTEDLAVAPQTELVELSGAGSLSLGFPCLQPFGSVGELVRSLAPRLEGRSGPFLQASAEPLFGLKVQILTQEQNQSSAYHAQNTWLFLCPAGGGWQYFLGALPPTSTVQQLRRYLHWAAQVRVQRQELVETLGWDHFEGRSWRGFHHHSCLILLAHGWQYFRV